MQNQKFFYCEKINDDYIIVWNTYIHSFMICTPYYNKTLQVGIKDFSFVTIGEEKYLLTLTDNSLTLYQSQEDSFLNIVFRLYLKNNDSLLQHYDIFMKFGEVIYRINEISISKVASKECLNSLQKFNENSGIAVGTKIIFEDNLYTLNFVTPGYAEDFVGMKITSLSGNKLGIYNSNFEN